MAAAWLLLNHFNNLVRGLAIKGKALQRSEMAQLLTSSVACQWYGGIFLSCRNTQQHCVSGNCFEAEHIFSVGGSSWLSPASRHCGLHGADGTRDGWPRQGKPRSAGAGVALISYWDKHGSAKDYPWKLKRNFVLNLSKYGYFWTSAC